MELLLLELDESLLDEDDEEKELDVVDGDEDLDLFFFMLCCTSREVLESFLLQDE